MPTIPVQWNYAKGWFSKLKYLAESCTKRTPPRNVMWLIRSSCVVDLGCIFNVIQQFVKYSSCDLVVRQESKVAVSSTKFFICLQKQHYKLKIHLLFQSLLNCTSKYFYHSTLFLTLLLPQVTKTEFLLTTSLQYQPDKWQE